MLTRRGAAAAPAAPAASPPAPAALTIPQVSIELRPEGVLVRCDPMPADAAVLAACCEHAAAQLQLLSAATFSQHGRDASLSTGTGAGSGHGLGSRGGPAAARA